ncbi:MAG: glycine/sarcosine/betaine reductase complex component C subunit beta [Syntrophomonadaceae bacterium]|nr:glycine/sarcosine/betaine reductase complex component C subunit beta [Syntrophomonadaceae bacterium]MDD3888528.1 glycine/sarcosine/betaine reductase complex component C subunit beta [Syntrophomonadaceae bacterium]MDD4548629.1 glycine/sarcosine/betaine reductase complex component C subunit beta [Syntrophomonadaceae bacterium]
MNFPVIKGTGYVLVHAPNMMLEHGTTITVEKAKNPGSDFLKAIPDHIRSFEETVKYAPNQVYIGNLSPRDLETIPQPWFENFVEDADRQGKYGEIMPEKELYGLMKIVDRFELVELNEEFSAEIKEILKAKDIFTENQLALFDKPKSMDEISALVKNDTAKGLYDGDKLLGCVREAHESDPCLTADVVFENLVTKASGVLAMIALFKKNNIDPSEVDYIIEASEEAIGDMNQRGGGNMAKACGEVAGCINATGIDMRGFCAGPSHAFVNAAGLVQSGIFKNVVVMAGGCTAKLGMNGRDHINKKMPLVEDMIGGFAVLVSENDGVNPVIRTDILGKHKISSGSAPQAVIQAIVVDPLTASGMKISDIDVFAPELQNPEITVPAGAGDVPVANYKMIGAMAIKRGELEKKELMEFTKKHGVIGFAPTQGHIPSGVPLIGYIRDSMLAGEMTNAMLIGKGSLFLGRMTDLFDGISFIIQKNSGELSMGQDSSASDEFKQEIREMIAEAMQGIADSLARR